MFIGADKMDVTKKKTLSVQKMLAMGAPLSVVSKTLHMPLSQVVELNQYIANKNIII